MTRSKPGELSEKQLAFVREYVVDLNGAAAAERAGYSPKSSRYAARELMKNAAVRAAIDVAIAERAARTELTADNVLQSLQRLSLKAEADGEYAAAIRAQQLRGMHLKLFTEKHEHGGIGGGPVQLTISGSEVDH